MNHGELWRESWTFGCDLLALQVLGSAGASHASSRRHKSGTFGALRHFYRPLQWHRRVQSDQTSSKHAVSEPDGTSTPRGVCWLFFGRRWTWRKTVRGSEIGFKMTFNPLLHGGFVLSVSTKLGRFGPAKIRCDCTWFAGHVATPKAQLDRQVTLLGPHSTITGGPPTLAGNDT